MSFTILMYLSVTVCRTISSSLDFACPVQYFTVRGHVVRFKVCYTEATEAVKALLLTGKSYASVRVTNSNPRTTSWIEDCRLHFLPKPEEGTQQRYVLYVFDTTIVISIVT